MYRTVVKYYTRRRSDVRNKCVKTTKYEVEIAFRQHESHAVYIIAFAATLTRISPAADWQAFVRRGTKPLDSVILR